MKEIVDYWIEKAFKSYKSACLELDNDMLEFAVNRLYYSMFYIISAYFFKYGRTFRKHSGLKTNFHKELVKTKIISVKYGELFDILFEARTESDYGFIFDINKNDIIEWKKEVYNFLKVMEKLIREDTPNDI